MYDKCFGTNLKLSAAGTAPFKDFAARIAPDMVRIRRLKTETRTRHRLRIRADEAETAPPLVTRTPDQIPDPRPRRCIDRESFSPPPTLSTALSWFQLQLDTTPTLSFSCRFSLSATTTTAPVYQSVSGTARIESNSGVRTGTVGSSIASNPIVRVRN